ncbi:hypothetical protein ACFVYJ_12560 [Pontibacter sp. JAM-7]|uniref:hypothetical protein n=1 Tax=Pontibacter sp. JAM-7 TaxID=3366581 RepID=UPI003AF711C1
MATELASDTLGWKIDRLEFYLNRCFQAECSGTGITRNQAVILLAELVDQVTEIKSLYEKSLSE